MSSPVPPTSHRPCARHAYGEAVVLLVTAGLIGFLVVYGVALAAACGAAVTVTAATLTLVRGGSFLARLTPPPDQGA
ncbi:hypothetical protein CLV40_1491 [Actinokineospora auranticolor]|uniref:Uncharacterized protein n=1 Tax=Actinokineospora auranticolor TaxID=155976 RepID=A0A2S6GB22_9PSEU|nr:hypothetical protein CLV40_1491 [Actinokineospora auranticolor]